MLEKHITLPIKIHKTITHQTTITTKSYIWGTISNTDRPTGIIVRKKEKLAVTQY